MTLHTEAESIKDAELVACTNCGAVFELRGASDMTYCPVCDSGGPHKSVPKYGNVRKWWERV